MKTLLRVVVFYGLAFVFTIILSVVQQTLGIDANKIILPQFGPALAALLMLVLFRRDQVKLALTFKKIPFQKYLAAIGIPIAVAGLLFLIYRQFFGSLSLPRLDVASFLLMLGGMLLGAFGEELGWRGYLQNLLDKRSNGLIAFLVVGILWGLWHVGNYQNGSNYMLFFVFSTIGYSAGMAWLLRGTNHNVILATLFHFGVNAGYYLLKDGLTDLRLIILNGLVWLGAAILITVLYKKDFLPLRRKKTLAHSIQGETT